MTAPKVKPTITANPDFGRSVNPISTRWDRLCPPNYYWHPRIFRPSDCPVNPMTICTFLTRKDTISQKTSKFVPEKCICRFEDLGIIPQIFKSRKVMLRSSFHSAIISFLGRMLTIPKNQGRGKEVPEPRPLQRLRRRKIPLITKPLCQPQNQGQKSNQRSKKPLQRKKNMSTLYSSVMSVSSISVMFFDRES